MPVGPIFIFFLLFISHKHSIHTNPGYVLLSENSIFPEFGAEHDIIYWAQRDLYRQDWEIRQRPGTMKKARCTLCAGF